MTLHAPAEISVQHRQFTLDGTPIMDPLAWAVTELSADEQERFGSLKVGESTVVGGGAGAEFTLTRTR